MRYPKSTKMTKENSENLKIFFFFIIATTLSNAYKVLYYLLYYFEQRPEETRNLINLQRQRIQNLLRCIVQAMALNQILTRIILKSSLSKPFINLWYVFDAIAILLLIPSILHTNNYGLITFLPIVSSLLYFSTSISRIRILFLGNYSKIWNLFHSNSYLIWDFLFVIWATSWDYLWKQYRRRSACASMQSDQRLCCSLPG